MKKTTSKGGKQKFITKLKKLVQTLDFKVKVKIHVNYTINIHGKIKNVTIDEELPIKLIKQIINFFENIEGWEPGIQLNRKIPVSYSIPLNFKG
ncbi:hypothetical protein [Tenacibaculum sp. nBUS_03]|uniref:hypothetical protein n=1 Tax=Tenacibaculum sp. nBUS_03 TaxID=3395320 RepID=UPI003EB84BD5